MEGPRRPREVKAPGSGPRVRGPDRTVDEQMALENVSLRSRRCEAFGHQSLRGAACGLHVARLGGWRQAADPRRVRRGRDFSLPGSTSPQGNLLGKTMSLQLQAPVWVKDIV